MTHTEEAMQAQARLYSREGKLFPASSYRFGGGFGGGFGAADMNGDGIVDPQEFFNAASTAGPYAFQAGPYDFQAGPYTARGGPQGGPYSSQGYGAYGPPGAAHRGYGGYGHPAGFNGPTGRLPIPMSGIYHPPVTQFAGSQGSMAGAVAGAAKTDETAAEKDDVLDEGVPIDAHHQGSLPGSLLAFGGPGFGAPIPYSVGYGVTYPGAAMPGSYAHAGRNPFSNMVDAPAGGLPGYGTMANGPYGGAHIGAYKPGQLGPPVGQFGPPAHQFGPGQFAGAPFSGYQGLGPYGSKAAYPYQYQGGGVHPVSGRPLAPRASKPELAVEQ